MGSDIEKKVKAFLDAYSQNDVNKTISYFTDDIVYTDMALERTYNGKKEFADFFNQFLVNFPDQKWELLSIFSTTDKVAFESIWSGTHTNTNNSEHPAHGKFVELKAATIMEFRGDNICKVNDYYNIPMPPES